MPRKQKQENYLERTLAELIHKDWTNDTIEPVYRLYDLYEPHCDKAAPYPETGGAMRFTCRHEIENGIEQK